MSSSDSYPFNRKLVYICLGLAIALAAGTIAASKFIALRVAQEPISLNTLNSPLADSPECASLIDALPDKAGDLTRRQLVDPAPPGAAAFSNDPSNRVTVRCGVELPLQYNTVALTSEIENVTWLPVFDDTTGSSMQTWYSVKTTPAVAVTLDDASHADSEEILEDLSEPVRALPAAQPSPNKAPLSTLTTQSAPQCEEILTHLPKEIKDYQKLTLTKDSGLNPQNSVVWTSTGKEPIVLRCGVSDPAGYHPGAQLIQVNDVPWFEDTTLRSGTTAGVWYPLGRSVNLAVSVPTSAGDSTLVTISDVLKEYS